MDIVVVFAAAATAGALPFLVKVAVMEVRHRRWMRRWKRELVENHDRLLADMEAGNIRPFSGRHPRDVT